MEAVRKGLDMFVEAANGNLNHSQRIMSQSEMSRVADDYRQSLNSLAVSYEKVETKHGKQEQSQKNQKPSRNQK